MTGFSALTESRIRDIQSRAADRATKRAEDAAKRQREQESRETLSPNDVLARERHIAACKYWQEVYKAEEARKQQEKIREANPMLVKLKAEYLVDTTRPNRRVVIIEQFIELYRQAYGKQVDPAVLTAEWNELRRKAALAKFYGTIHDTAIR